MAVSLVNKVFFCFFFKKEKFLSTFTGHEASDGVRAAASRLHKLHLGHDDVVLQDGAAARADGIAAGLVHVDVRAAAVRTRPGAHGAAARPDGK